MARIKLDLPQHFLFTTSLKVRVTDLNYGGHVGNDNVLSIVHEARMQFLLHLGYKSELDIAENIGIIVTDAAIVYKSESFYNDELTIKIAVDDFNKYGFDMFYEISNTKTGKEVARAKTGIICMNYKERKIAEIPEVLKKKLTL